MTELKPKFTTDILFKSLFTQYPKLLKHLTAILLEIPLNRITQFIIQNPEMTPDEIDKKFCRLDIRMMVNKQNINIEVQVKNEGDYPERALFYWARMYSASLPVKDEYRTLPRTISINILNFPLFKGNKDFHSEYRILDVERYTQLTDKMILHFFELPKISRATGDDSLLLQWLSLFKAKTYEELERINELGVPELSEAIGAYHTITASPEYQELERMRLKASLDEANALSHADKRGEKRGAKAERKKWKIVVDGKDAELADKDAELKKLRKQLADRE